MKKLSVLLLIVSLFSFSVFSQELEADDFAEAEIYEAEAELEEFDDFDSIFADAEDLDEAVVDEEKKPETPAEIVACAFSSLVRFSGSFSGDVGIAYVHKEDEAGDDDNVSGFFSLKNTLNMTVTPVNTFVIRGSVYTGIDNGFALALNSFYFDYLLLDRVYISAGYKGVSWGNLRLFTSGHSNIFSEDGTNLALDIKYPWSWGTLTFAATGNNTASAKPNQFNYYGSLEFSVFNTNINLYAKRPAKNTDPVRNNLAGLELKRTIFGFDTYAQGIVRFKDYKKLNSSEGYEYIVATAGLYRLWESFDPNVGFNIEYQYEYAPGAEHEHYNKVAFEGGLKRIGKRKNVKVGVMTNYDFTENNGESGVNLIVSGILPYADWSNKVGVQYGTKYETPVVLVSSSLALALDY